MNGDGCGGVCVDIKSPVAWISLILFFPLHFIYLSFQVPIVVFVFPLSIVFLSVFFLKKCFVFLHANKMLY